MKNKKHLIWLVLLTQLIICFSLYKDFPITWDEETSRLGTGRANVEFILGNDQDSLLINHEKYHGPAFEILLYAFEKAFNLKNEKEIYQYRHLWSHLVFLLFAFFFFQNVHRKTQNIWLALMAWLILYTSPRLFADSFNNSKDLVYFSFYGMALLSGMLWFEKKDYKNLILHAFLCGFLLAIRLTGLVLIPISMFIFAIAENGFSIKKYFLPNHLAKQVMYLALSTLICILFWPVMWDGPLHHFTEAWKEMKQFGWGGEVLFKGEYFYASQLPFIYPIRWMMISIPLPYQVLALLGLFVGIMQLKNIAANTDKLYIILSFLVPFSAIVFMRPVLYDGWRHLYFVYAPMLFLMVYTLLNVLNWLQRQKQILKVITAALCIVFFTWMIYTMIQLHPLQNVYFNRLAGKNLNRARMLYDVDYWGTSVKECLDYIVANDPSDTIRILYDYDPVYLNAKLLEEKDQKRIVFKNREDWPTYRINLYRFRPEKYVHYKPVFHVVRDGGIVSSVYKKLGQN